MMVFLFSKSFTYFSTSYVFRGLVFFVLHREGSLSDVLPFLVRSEMPTTKPHQAKDTRMIHSAGCVSSLVCISGEPTGSNLSEGPDEPAAGTGSMPWHSKSKVCSDGRSHQSVP